MLLALSWHASTLVIVCLFFPVYCGVYIALAKRGAAAGGSTTRGGEKIGSQEPSVKSIFRACWLLDCLLCLRACLACLPCLLICLLAAFLLFLPSLPLFSSSTFFFCCTGLVFSPPTNPPPSSPPSPFHNEKKRMPTHRLTVESSSGSPTLTGSETSNPS